MPPSAHRLALGTAQIGARYGIANRHGKVSDDELPLIIDTMRASGADTVDTAVAYGNAEARLGVVGVRGMKVISKLPPAPPGADVRAWATQTIGGCLERLRIPRLHAILMHRPADLMSDEGELIYQTLGECKAEGQVGGIGVSIYDPEELGPLVNRYRLDIVQAPFNVIDRRLESSGWLARLCAANIEVHVRSAFLQGALLLDRAALPPHFARWDSIWDRWSTWISGQGVSPVQACLGFVLARAEVTRVVVGVETSDQLRDLIAAAGCRHVEPPADLASDDIDLVNPSRWPI